MRIDDYRIGKNNDKRIKLAEQDKQEICKLREQGKSQRELARMYNVSRRLITFIIDPEKHKQNLQRRNERGGSKQYYKKESHRLYMQAYRARLKEIHKKTL